MWTVPRLGPAVAWLVCIWVDSVWSKHALLSFCESESNCGLHAFCSDSGKCECEFGNLASLTNIANCEPKRCFTNADCLGSGFDHSRCDLDSTFCVCDTVNFYKLDDDTQKCVHEFTHQHIESPSTNLWVWVIPVVVASLLLSLLAIGLRFYFVYFLSRKRQFQEAARPQAPPYPAVLAPIYPTVNTMANNYPTNYPTRQMPYSNATFPTPPPAYSVT